MEQKEFNKNVEDMLSILNAKGLRRALHGIARKTPANKREVFLQLLQDSHIYENLKDNNARIQYKRLMSNEKVEVELQKIKSFFDEIKNEDLAISAHSYEDYSYGYMDDQWVWEYEDDQGVGQRIVEAILFAHDCVNDCRYKEAAEVFDLVMEAEILAWDKDGGDYMELGIEEFVEEGLASINMKALALEVLYSNYQFYPLVQRAGVLYSYFQVPFIKDISIEEIFSVGREELTDLDEFYRVWIDFLMMQKSEVATRLLNEGIRYSKGTEGLLEYAKESYKKHPSIYLTALLEYEKNSDYTKMRDIGKEALGKLDAGLKIRSEIALKTAEAAFYLDDELIMKECWYEAFYSSSTIPNYLRLFTDEEAVMKYKSLAEGKVKTLEVRTSRHTYGGVDSIKEDEPNILDEFEYKSLNFFAGQFNKVKQWCSEQKSALGWSNSFIGVGIDLLLLNLFQGQNPKIAIETVACRVSQSLGFNDIRNHLFMQRDTTGSIVIANSEVDQNHFSVFWSVFNKWKSYYEAIDKIAYIEWLESVIEKRVDGIVGGTFRSRYEDVALLVAALGEVKESLGLGRSKEMDIDKYMKKYPRHSSFRSKLTKYS